MADLSYFQLRLYETPCLLYEINDIGCFLMPFAKVMSFLQTAKLPQGLRKSFNSYKSKLSSLSRKSNSPIVSIPSSLRRGIIWSLTTMIFLKESLIFVSERDS